MEATPKFRLTLGGLPGTAGFILSSTERLFKYEHEGWGVEFETWGEFIQRFQSDLKIRLAEYRQQLVDLAASREWKPDPNLKYKPYHYKWLALYQVCGESPAKILEKTNKHSMDATTVLKSITKIASAIGLTLRPPKKGQGHRPRRAKT